MAEYRRVEERLKTKEERENLFVTFHLSLIQLGWKEGNDPGLIMLDRNRAHVDAQCLLLVERLIEVGAGAWGHTLEHMLKLASGGFDYQTLRAFQVVIPAAIEETFVVFSDESGFARESRFRELFRGVRSITVMRAAAYALLGETPKK